MDNRSLRAAILGYLWLSVRFAAGVAILVALGSVRINAADLAAPTSRAEKVAIAIRVFSPAGDRVPEAYIGVVPSWRPESRPLRERVADSGSSTFEVPEGSYRIIAGARHYGIVVAAVTVSSSSRSFTIKLRPLALVEGTVSDELGNPITGARVALVNAAIAPPLGMLSELAVGHLREEWETRTNDEGSWSLRMPIGTVPILVSRHGFATRYVTHRAEDRQPLDVFLAKGGALRLAVDRSDSDLVMTLRAVGGGSTVPSELQPQIWAQWANRATLEWDSLPPGDYSIYAKYPDHSHFMERGAHLADVTVSPAVLRDLRVVLPPQRAKAQRIVSFFLKGTRAEDLGDVVAAFGRGADGRPQRVDHLTEEVTGGIVVHLKADNVGPPFYALGADHFVSNIAERAASESDDLPLTGTMQPLATASLHLRSAEKDLQLPSASAAVFRDCRSAARIAAQAEVRQDGLLVLNAPAGCRSASLFLDGFETAVLEKPLEPGHHDLGDMVVHAAAAADLHVVRDPSGEPAPSATVRVRVASDERPDRLVIVVAEAPADDRGWAHVTGLPTFRDLEVTAETVEGRRSLPVSLRLRPREHAVVDPVRVVEPATLIVVPKLRQELRGRYPGAQVAVIFIKPADPHLEPDEKRQQIVAQEEQAVRFERLLPGAWRISGVVKVAGSHAMVDVDDLVLKAGETRTIEAVFEPQVFSGTVTQGGKGIAARLTLADPFARPGGVKQICDSAADGTFHVVLPRQGTFAVEAARLTSQHDFVAIGDVDFVEPARQIEIALPESRVIARVQSAGRSLSKAEVTLRLFRDGNAGVESYERGRLTDEAGEAAFDAVASGDVVLTAREPGSSSVAQKTVAVEAGKDVHVDLDLRPAVRLSGTINDPAGVRVPGAMVDCLISFASGAVESVGSMSDADGRFQLELDGRLASPALCGVIAPTGVAAFEATPGEAVSVSLPEAVGLLRIPDWGAHVSDTVYWLAAPDGRVVHLASVAVRMGRSGAPLTIPALAVGQWRLLRIDSLDQWRALARGMAGSLSGISDVVVRPGEASVVRLDAGASEGSRSTN